MPELARVPWAAAAPPALGASLHQEGERRLAQPSAVKSLSGSPHPNVLKDTYDYIWY
jgi:hypothetical protein